MLPLGTERFGGYDGLDLVFHWNHAFSDDFRVVLVVGMGASTYGIRAKVRTLDSKSAARVVLVPLNKLRPATDLVTLHLRKKDVRDLMQGHCNVYTAGLAQKALEDRS